MGVLLEVGSVSPLVAVAVEAVRGLSAKPKSDRVSSRDNVHVDERSAGDADFPRRVAAGDQPGVREPEHMHAFAELQQRLPAALAANRPGSQQEHVVAGLPSYSLGATILDHYRPLLGPLEHRFLLAMLMLPRIPGEQMVLVSCKEPEEALLDYYARLADPTDPDEKHRHAAIRVVVPCPRKRTHLPRIACAAAIRICRWEARHADEREAGGGVIAPSAWPPRATSIAVADARLWRSVTSPARGSR